MRQLVRVELTRLRWRRSIVVLLVACLLVPAIIFVSHAWSTRPLSAADVAAAERQAEIDASQPYVQEEISACEDDPEMYVGPDGSAADCVEMITPSPENYLWRQQLDVPQTLDDQGVAVVALLAVFMLLVGTTFVGHDWNTGSISNQLLFDPRRLRVWIAKAVAVVVTGAVAGAAVLALYWGAVAVLAAQRDIGVPPGTWADVRDTSLRGIVLVALAGLLGYALTMLFRSTVATLAVGLGIATAGSLGLLAVLGDSAIRWLLPTNALAVLRDGYEYYVWDMTCGTGRDVTGMGGSEPCVQTLGLGAGATYLGVLLVVVVAASVWSFRSRDLP